MNIPEEAVEAAAERLHFWSGHVVEWKSMHEAAKDGWRAEARAALEAAAPLLMAQALREASVKRWICEVVRSGYHNGAHCSPVDPHEGWNCGYFYEYTYCVPAAELET